MISVQYSNNVKRYEPRIVDETITTPRQFVEETGVRLGNYDLQLNGVPLGRGEVDNTFDSIIQREGFNKDLEFCLAGVKPSNGGVPARVA